MPSTTITYDLHIGTLILRDLEARGLQAIPPVRFYASWAQNTITAEADCEPPPPVEGAEAEG